MSKIKILDKIVKCLMFNKIEIVLELNDHTTKTLIGFKLNQVVQDFWSGTVIIIVIYYYSIILYYF